MPTILERIIESEHRLVLFLKGAPVYIPEQGLVAGFALVDRSLIEKSLYDSTNAASDNYHYPMGTSFLKYGFAGIADAALANIDPSKTEEEIQNLRSMAVVYREVVAFIERHIDKIDSMLTAANATERSRLLQMRENLAALAAGAPQTFAQAVQAYYIAWRIRCVTGSSTIGRLDQYLYPFYESDRKNGRITDEQALALICDLWERMNECGSGDTLMNIMLGGSTPDGCDQSNELSILMMKATRMVAKTEPHINVRIHAGMPTDYLEELCRLQLCGFGQGSIFNDEIIIPALIAGGIPEELAYRYANDGCTEIVIDGFSAINFERVDVMKCLELTLYNGHPNELPGSPKSIAAAGFESGDPALMQNFDEIYAAFQKQFFHQIDRIAERLDSSAKWHHAYAVASPYLNGTFEELLASGKDLNRGGFPVKCVLMFAGSIPTVADSLAALRDVVFDKRHYTMHEVLQALTCNFEGYDAMRSELLSAPKFGNDDDYVDLIAARIANDFCDRLAQLALTQETKLWPALFCHLFIQEATSTGATPDGRKWKDPIAEHFSATPGKAVSGPTALLASVAKGPMMKSYGSSMTHISLSRTFMPDTDASIATLRDLIKSAADMGIFSFNVAIYDTDKLREAQRHPEANKDLIVRVWGYSARFVDLSEEMQNHVISRVAAR